jgi:hypothetical protein
MFTFTAKNDSGESLRFESDSRDVANWERTTKGATMGSLAAGEGAGLSFSALYKIAWFAARRLMLIPQDMTLPAFQTEYAIDIEPDQKPAESDEDGPMGDDEGDDMLDAGEALSGP